LLTQSNCTSVVQDYQNQRFSCDNLRLDSLDQEQELAVFLLGVAYPLVRPAHASHHVAFVVDFDNFDQFSGASLITSFSSAAVARPAGTVRQDDVPAFSLL
jgi:hypothetical protein